MGAYLALLLLVLKHLSIRIQSAANIFILTGQFHAYVKNDMRKYKFSYRVH